MKTLAFMCMMLGCASMVMSLVIAALYHEYRPIVQSAGSLLLGSLIYFTINDKGEPDGKA